LRRSPAGNGLSSAFRAPFAARRFAVPWLFSLGRFAPWRRDLSEFEVVYLFVDGIAERLHLGQPREAVLAAWGVLADGNKVLLHLAPGTKEDTASCREFFQDLRRRGLPDPLLVVSDGAPGLIRAIEECFPRALGASALSRPQAAQPAEQGARRPVAGVQGARHRLLPGRLAGARPLAAL